MNTDYFSEQQNRFVLTVPLGAAFLQVNDLENCNMLNDPNERIFAELANQYGRYANEDQIRAFVNENRQNPNEWPDRRKY